MKMLETVCNASPTPCKWRGPLLKFQVSGFTICVHSYYISSAHTNTYKYEIKYCKCISGDGYLSIIVKSS